MGELWAGIRETDKGVSTVRGLSLIERGGNKRSRAPSPRRIKASSTVADGLLRRFAQKCALEGISVYKQMENLARSFVFEAKSKAYAPLLDLIEPRWSVRVGRAAEDCAVIVFRGALFQPWLQMIEGMSAGQRRLEQVIQMIENGAGTRNEQGSFAPRPSRNGQGACKGNGKRIKLTPRYEAQLLAEFRYFCGKRHVWPSWAMRTLMMRFAEGGKSTEFDHLATVFLGEGTRRVTVALGRGEGRDELIAIANGAGLQNLLGRVQRLEKRRAQEFLLGELKKRLGRDSVQLAWHELVEPVGFTEYGRTDPLRGEAQPLKRSRAPTLSGAR